MGGKFSLARLVELDPKRIVYVTRVARGTRVRIDALLSSGKRVRLFAPREEARGVLWERLNDRLARTHLGLEECAFQDEHLIRIEPARGRDRKPRILLRFKIHTRGVATIRTTAIALMNESESGEAWETIDAIVSIHMAARAADAIGAKFTEKNEGFWWSPHVH